VDDDARYQMDVGWIMRHCREPMDLIMDVGARGFGADNPVQRAWRDVATASRHGFLLPPVNQEIHGRHLPGTERTTSLL
jgi:hypothetical protein